MTRNEFRRALRKAVTPSAELFYRADIVNDELEPKPKPAFADILPALNEGRRERC